MNDERIIKIWSSIFYCVTILVVTALVAYFTPLWFGIPFAIVEAIKLKTGLQEIMRWKQKQK